VLWSASGSSGSQDAKEKECAMDESARKSEGRYGVVSASKIIGEAVVNRQDENLGKIHELVVDAKEGHMAYAVLSFGGFMGMGNKLFAMPWKAFEFSADGDKLILNVDKKKLEAAPGFDKDSTWPDFADRTWGGGIYKYYGYDPYWKL
jgi:sporulation protein YlmC with PRC-barrel domain